MECTEEKTRSFVRIGDHVINLAAVIRVSTANFGSHPRDSRPYIDIYFHDAAAATLRLYREESRDTYDALFTWMCKQPLLVEAAHLQANGFTAEARGAESEQE